MSAATQHMQFADALSRTKSAIADEVVGRQYAHDPALEQRFGPTGRERCLEDVGYHLAYLAPALRFGERGIFHEYVAWLKSMLGARGVTEHHIKQNFELLNDVLREQFGDVAESATNLIRDTVAALPTFPTEPPSELDPAAPYHSLAAEFVQRLREMDARGAHRIIREALEGKVSIIDLHEFVLTPALREMGRLWQVNAVTVAHEHFASRVTQSVLAQLEPHLESNRRRNRTVLSFCPAGEDHATGLRMVSDAFDMDGWTTFDLGGNLPAASLRNMMFRMKPDIILLSLATALNIESIQRTIAQIRASASFVNAKVLVGGGFFGRFPQICAAIEADSCAATPREAVATARDLLSEPA